jgi:nucleoid DNA-binding protein
MKIGIYISELLFEHESVILPGLGEFYTRYNPARFVPELQKVESPSKQVAFNPGKTEGDTPLVDYLAEKEGMDTERVRRYLDNFAAEVRQLLSEGKQFKLEKIGILSTAPDGHLLLEPDRSVNYLSEAAGMGSITQPEKKAEGAPLPEPGEEAPAAAAAPAASPVPPADTPPEEAAGIRKTELPPALRWVAYTVVPLLVIIIILALNFSFFFGEGGLLRSGKQATEAPAAVPADPPETEAAVEEPARDAGQAAEETPEVTPPAGDAATAAAPRTDGPTYYIVVGSFPDREVADRYVERLRAQGASQAAVFMQTGFGYHRVAYAVYNDLSEAEAVLETVKEQINQDAYILHR